MIVRPTGWLPDPRAESEPRGLLATVPAAPQLSDDDGPLSTGTHLYELVQRTIDQLHLNSCLGCSLVHVIETLLARFGLTGRRYSALAAYMWMRMLSRLERQDGGAFMVDGITSATQLGVCLESFWPYDPARVFDAPPMDADVNAINHVLLDVERITDPTPEGRLRAVIRTFELGGLVWDGKLITEQYAAFRGTGVLRPPRPTDRRVGGHGTMLAGHRRELGGSTSLRQVGSWPADEWGDNAQRGICAGWIDSGWLDEAHELIAVRRVSLVGVPSA